MKTIIAIALAMLMVLTIIPLAEARTLEETWNQKLISHIHYSPARLKNFCMSYDVSKAYQNKVCRTINQDCIDFLEEKQDEWCSEILGYGIRDFNSKLNFKAMREYLREHRLHLLTRHEETTTTIEPTTTVTGSSSSRKKR